MTENNKASEMEASSSAPSEDLDHPIDPFESAIEAQRNNMLNAKFARTALKVALIALSLLVMWTPFFFWLGMKAVEKETKYFATVNGSVLEQHPTSEPAYSDDGIIDFGDKLIRKGFQLDFKNYRSQINDQQQNFSESGFRSYYLALTNSNIFKKVVEDKLIMSANVTRKGVIYRRGREVENGPYIWDVQYPVTLSLDGQTKSYPSQNFIFTIRIQRADVNAKPIGIEATSVITRDAR